MFRLIVLLAVAWAALFIFPVSTAAEDTSSDDVMRAGSWALQFRITRDFTLGDFQGFIISAQRHSSNRSAWRFGLGIDGSVRDSDAEFTVIEDGTPVQENDEGGESSYAYNVEIDAQYIRYPNPSSRVKFFFGGGPTVGVDDFRVEEIHEYGWRRDERMTISAGVSGLVGATWFFAKSMSLHAEYGAVLSYIWLDEEREDFFARSDTFERMIGDSGHEVRLQARGVLFGISAYF